MRPVRIRTILHSLQRYNTVGDYYLDKYGTRQFLISRLDDEKMEFLVSIHEQIEEFMTRMRGISEESIRRFDEQYEADRIEGDTSEPGWSPMAPYRKEHAFAEKIERQIAKEIGVNWERYESKVNSL